MSNIKINFMVIMSFLENSFAYKLKLLLNYHLQDYNDLFRNFLF